MFKTVFDDALAEYELTAAARRARVDRVSALYAADKRHAGGSDVYLMAQQACDVLEAVEDVITKREGPTAAAAAVETLLGCVPGRRMGDAHAWAAIARMTGSVGIGHAVALFRGDLQHSPASLQMACDQIKSSRLDPTELLQLAAEHRLDYSQLGGVVDGILRRQS